MTNQELLGRMDKAFREDRERFFRVADTLAFQPKYKEHLEELEALKQQWRDIPQQESYPNITHPMPLPDWFPKVHFASSWKKDVYLERQAELQRRAEERKQRRKL